MLQQSFPRRKGLQAPAKDPTKKWVATTGFEPRISVTSVRSEHHHITPYPLQFRCALKTSLFLTELTLTISCAQGSLLDVMGAELVDKQVVLLHVGFFVLFRQAGQGSPEPLGEVELVADVVERDLGGVTQALFLCANHFCPYRKMFPFSWAHSHTSTNATRRHKYLRGSWADFCQCQEFWLPLLELRFVGKMALRALEGRP